MFLQGSFQDMQVGIICNPDTGYLVAIQFPQCHSKKNCKYVTNRTGENPTVKTVLVSADLGNVQRGHVVSEATSVPVTVDMQTPAP